MSFRSLVAAVLPPVVVLLLGAGHAHAQPLTGAAGVPDIGYETRLAGDSVLTTLTHGTFEITGDGVSVVDAAGRAVITLPLTLRAPTGTYPLPYSIRDGGAVLELRAPAVALEFGEPEFVASPLENMRAQDNFLSQFGIATAIGSFLGTLVGGAIGLVGFLGGVVGIGTVVTGAAIGAVVGTLLVGGPALLVAGIEMMQTLNAPPGASKWAETAPR